jgi:rapamycin-insensitive companion of mTOR
MQHRDLWPGNALLALSHNNDNVCHRMKSKPEYRSVFSSPPIFYRALHNISTQRYRLPVRRYILDLFDIELNAEVVQSLSEYAISLRAPPSFKMPNQPANPVVGVFGPLGRSRRSSESDGDEDELDMGTTLVQPAISLRPVSVITGFTT